MISQHNGDPRMPGLVRWYGGKGRMLAKIIPLIPYSHIYCEPFGGAGSILVNLKPRPVEVYNDLNGNLVNLARVLQDPETCRELEYRLERTLYSREEFREALRTLKDSLCSNVELAWAFFVAQNQGFSGKAICAGAMIRYTGIASSDDVT